MDTITQIYSQLAEYLGALVFGVAFYFHFVLFLAVALLGSLAYGIVSLSRQARHRMAEGFHLGQH